MGTLQAQLLIAWDGVSWTDESEYLVSATGTFSFAAPADFLVSGGGIVNSANITLSNAADRYVARMSALDFFQRHVRLAVNVGSGMERIFSGVINGVQMTAPNPGTASQLVLQCQTMEGPYLQRKFDLSLADFVAMHTSPNTEREWFQLICDRLSIPLTRVFDTGMVNIPWLWADDESALEEMWKAAAAAGGVIYTNVLGHLVYKNASSIAKDIVAPKETLSRTANSYSIATLDVNQDDLYSDVVVEVSTRSISDVEQLWTPEDYADLVVPPLGSLVVNAVFDDPAYSIESIEWEAKSSSGGSMTSSVTMTHEDFAQKSKITFTNANSSTAAIIPYIRVNGSPVSGRVSFERTANSVNSFWTNRDRRTRSVRSNVYIQTPVQGKFLADIILAESEVPRAIVQLNGLPGKPSRFIGDVVVIQDTRVKTTNIVGQIEQMSWSLTNTYQQSITVQDFANIYPYANTPGYFIVGTDAVCGAERLFF